MQYNTWYEDIIPADLLICDTRYIPGITTLVINSKQQVSVTNDEAVYTSYISYEYDVARLSLYRYQAASSKHHKVQPRRYLLVIV